MRSAVEIRGNDPRLALGGADLLNDPRSPLRIATVHDHVMKPSGCGVRGDPSGGRPMPPPMRLGFRRHPTAIALRVSPLAPQQLSSQSRAHRRVTVVFSATSGVPTVPESVTYTVVRGE